MRFLLAFILLCSVARGAITEYYVSVAGAGTADGSSEANAMDQARFVDYMTTGGTYTATAGDRFTLAAGTYPRTTNADTWVNGGNATSPVVIRGNATARASGRTAGGELVTTDFPVWTWTGSSAKLTVTGSFIIFEAISFDSQANSATVAQVTGNDCVYYRVKATNSGTQANGQAIGILSRCIALDCDFALTGASGGLSAASLLSGVYDSCRITTVQAVPCATASNNASGVIVNCTLHSGGGVGIAITGATASGIYARSNTIVSNGGDGIDVITGQTALQRFVGNMITDNGGYGIDLVSAGNAAFMAYNRTRDNTSGAINSGTDWAAATTFNHVTTDGGDATTDYLNASADDYRLKATSPATSAGIPLLQSIGAAQRDQTSSGGGETSHTFVQ